MNILSKIESPLRVLAPVRLDMYFFHDPLNFSYRALSSQFQNHWQVGRLFAVAFSCHLPILIDNLLLLSVHKVNFNARIHALQSFLLRFPCSGHANNLVLPLYCHFPTINLYLVLYHNHWLYLQWIVPLETSYTY